MRYQFAAVLLIAITPVAHSKDLGVLYGEPTPAFAMYAAQPAFAAGKCVSAGYTEDVKGAAAFVKDFEWGLTLRVYRKKDPDFVRELDSLLRRYADAWNVATPDARREFCEGFNREIVLKKGSYFKWISPLGYFRSKFSPRTEAADARIKRYLAVASVAGVAASTAAAVSAANDAVSSAKAGEFAVSNQQMQISHGFNQLGGAMNGVAAVSVSEANRAESVLEHEAADGFVRILRCPVVDHFFSYSAPVESSIWTTYQQVSVPCRDFVASDLGAAK